MYFSSLGGFLFKSNRPIKVSWKGKSCVLLIMHHNQALLTTDKQSSLCSRFGSLNGKKNRKIKKSVYGSGTSPNDRM